MIKSNNYNVRAFSIIEAVVGMVITAIVMGLIFVVFSIISERMIDYRDQNQPVNDMNRLTYSINKDIFENESMNTNENSVVFKGYDGRSVAYVFSPEQDYIIRSSETFTDTFKIANSRFTTEILANKESDVQFCRLRMLIEVNDQEMPLTFYKRIFSRELMQKWNEDEP